MLNNSNENHPVPPTSKATILLGVKTKMMLVLVLGIGGLAMLIYIMFVGTAVELQTVGAIAVAPATEDDAQVGMRGKLVSGSFVRQPNGITATFQMVDPDGVLTVPVIYSGELPSTLFNEHSEIIVRGQKSITGEFQAEDLQVKCPSKYEAASSAGEQTPYQVN